MFKNAITRNGVSIIQYILPTFLITGFQAFQLEHSGQHCTGAKLVFFIPATVVPHMHEYIMAF